MVLKLVEDGLEGNQTREAIKRFQAYVGITVDGDLGPITFGKMKSYTVGNQSK